MQRREGLGFRKSMQLRSIKLRIEAFGSRRRSMKLEIPIGQVKVWQQLRRNTPGCGPGDLVTSHTYSWNPN